MDRFIIVIFARISHKSGSESQKHTVIIHGVDMIDILCCILLQVKDSCLSSNGAFTSKTAEKSSWR